MTMSLLLQFSRKLGVVAIALWLAGAGCLLGCEGTVAAAAGQHHDRSANSNQTPTFVAEGDACASNEGHGCCKKKTRAHRNTAADAEPVAANHSLKQNQTGSRFAELPTSGMNTCPFAISRAIAVGKIHDGQISAIAAVPHVLTATSVREQKLPLSTTSPLPNRGHTYLRCCSFLI